MFAGHDCSYNLAKMSLNKDDLNKMYSELNPLEQQTLEEWYQKYQTKYMKVGRIQGY